jgi:hypothetical protein
MIDKVLTFLKGGANALINEPQKEIQKDRTIIIVNSTDTQKIIPQNYIPPNNFPLNSTSSTNLTDITANYDNQKIVIKSAQNGKYITAEPNNALLQAIAPNANSNQTIFTAFLTNDGYIVLKNAENSKYISADFSEEHNGQTPLLACAENVGRWECFKVFTDGQYFYLRSLASGKWVSVDVEKQNAPIFANAPEPSTWERLIIEKLP